MTAILKLRTLVIHPDPNSLHRASDKVVLFPPYLFEITLSVLFHDTDEAYQNTYGPRPSVLTSDFRLTDIEYAMTRYYSLEPGCRYIVFYIPSRLIR